MMTVAEGGDGSILGFSWSSGNEDDAIMPEEREGGGGTKKEGTERDTKDGEGVA